MSFSRSQHYMHFRPMVDRAWLAHCDRECITDSTSASKDAWYREQLRKCFGFDSTVSCDRGTDFEKAMAWFEEIAGDGITWQLRYMEGDLRRARFALEQQLLNLGISEEYVTSIARQAGIEHCLRDCTAQELINLKIALGIHQSRQRRRALNQGKEAAPTG